MSAEEVSLHEYVDRLIADLDRRFADLRTADQLAVKAALAAAEKAVETAKIASDEHLKAHNDVLDGWKTDRSTFVTREAIEERSRHVDALREADKAASDARFKRLESFQARMLGGIGVLAVIGLGNLIKLWLA